MKKSGIGKKLFCAAMCMIMMFSLSGCRYSDVIQQIIYDHYKSEEKDEDPPFQPEENSYENEDYSDDLNDLTDSEESDRKDESEQTQTSPDGTQTTTAGSSPKVTYNEGADANGTAETGTPSKVTEITENAGTSAASAQQSGTDGGTGSGGSGDGGTSYEGDPSAQTYKQVVDANGQQVDVPENVNSIAATGPAALMSLILAGENCLVASDANTVSSAASTGIFDSLSSTEALWDGNGNITISDAALSTLIEKKPDLVVESSGSNGLTDDQVGQLQAAGISYLVLPPMTDLDSVKTAVNTMAQVLGDKTSNGGKNAEEVASEFCTWVDNACSDIKDATKEYEYQAETDEDDKTTVLVDTTYTLYVDDWDSEAHYKLSNSRFAQMEGDGCAVVKIGPSESSTTISNFLGYANVINTSSKYGVVGKIKYFTPLVSSYLDWEITGPKASGVVKSGQPLLQQDDASLGTPYFPKVIVSSAEVKSQIENSPMWKVYPHINTGDGNFNSDGFLDQEGHIVSTQISGEYETVVNPKGLISDWTTGGCESILESLWAGWEFFDAISEDELKGYITDFYSTFYGYDLSGAQLDDILKGA